MYGPVAQLGFNSVLIVIQLLVSGVIVLLLDELLQKGYGFGSGTTLFIATNVCGVIMWKSLSPMSVPTEHGSEYEGCILAFFHLLITKPNKLNALYDAFFRQYAPNLSNLIATIVVGLVVNVF
jgi:protein transport protein SEC61 subunit alpha